MVLGLGYGIRGDGYLGMERPSCKSAKMPGATSSNTWDSTKKYIQYKRNPYLPKPPSWHPSLAQDHDPWSTHCRRTKTPSGSGKMSTLLKEIINWYASPEFRVPVTTSQTPRAKFQAHTSLKTGKKTSKIQRSDPSSLGQFSSETIGS